MRDKSDLARNTGRQTSDVNSRTVSAIPGRLATLANEFFVTWQLATEFLKQLPGTLKNPEFSTNGNYLRKMRIDLAKSILADTGKTGIQSSHRHMLLSMRYNTTLIAIIG